MAPTEVVEVNEKEIKINDPEKLNVSKNKNSKSKKNNKKRKNKSKESPEAFVFPKNIVMSDSPNKNPDPIEASNNFYDLEQDVEQQIPINIDPSEDSINKSQTPLPLLC
ncbi:hypothetical protein TNCV_4194871 [Trichonephila clavipes]|nr:hypothetical protein TNCV_4194871 [Trichonephila clavipes]